jgi:fermentation-respiration switch protein FrsA (DUF1100 family)
MPAEARAGDVDDLLDTRDDGALSLELLAVQPAGPDGDGGVEDLLLHTDRGDIVCRLHFTGDSDAAVLWVFGAGGGLGGPAGGVYERLGARLVDRGLTSLQVAYRRPGTLEECVLDVLVGLAYLRALDKHRLVLVGHSFGGAVVITAGAYGPDEVAGVVAMSSQSYGTEAAADLAPKPLLLIHGEADEVLPAACSRDIYERAGSPKRLILYPGCRHGLDQCRDDLDRDLTEWLTATLALDEEGEEGEK